MVSRKVPWGSQGENADSKAEKPGKGREKRGLADTRLLVGVDGRSPWVRRAKSVMAAFIVDLGGPDNVSAAERALARRAAVLTVQLEQIEAQMASGDNSITTLDHYGRGASHLRRLLEALGLRRRAKDITPGSALSAVWEIEGRPDEGEGDSQ